MLHNSKCGCITRREPPLADLKRWLAQGRAHTALEPDAEQKAAATAHMKLFDDMFPDARRAPARKRK